MGKAERHAHPPSIRVALALADAADAVPPTELYRVASVSSKDGAATLRDLRQAGLVTGTPRYPVLSREGWRVVLDIRHGPPPQPSGPLAEKPPHVRVLICLAHIGGVWLSPSEIYERAEIPKAEGPALLRQLREQKLIKGTAQRVLLTGAGWFVAGDAGARPAVPTFTYQ